MHDNRMFCELKLLYFVEIVSESLQCRSTLKVSSLIFCRAEKHCSDFLYRFYRYTLMLTALILCCLCLCVQWVRIGSPHQFLLPSCYTAVFYQSSPWREQSHEPLMRGFPLASTQPRLELMNKSNEWHVIIDQRMWDGQRIGASGRKPEIICLENLRNERE